MLAGIADTHTAIWYLYNDARLSSRAKTFIETSVRQGDQIGLSAITFAEIVYLIEKRKIPVESLSILAAQLDNPISGLTEIPFTLSLARTLSRINPVQIPDMPDRIIAATALHYNVPVISKDHRIQLPILTTIW